MIRGLDCALDWTSGVRQEPGMVLKDTQGGQQNEIQKEKGKSGKGVWEKAGGTWKHRGLGV